MVFFFILCLATLCCRQHACHQHNGIKKQAQVHIRVPPLNTEHTGTMDLDTAPWTDCELTGLNAPASPLKWLASRPLPVRPLCVQPGGSSRRILIDPTCQGIPWVINRHDDTQTPLLK